MARKNRTMPRWTNWSKSLATWTTEMPWPAISTSSKPNDQVSTTRWPELESLKSPSTKWKSRSGKPLCASPEKRLKRRAKTQHKYNSIRSWTKTQSTLRCIKKRISKKRWTKSTNSRWSRMPMLALTSFQIKERCITKSRIQDMTSLAPYQTWKMKSSPLIWMTLM